MARPLNPSLQWHVDHWRFRCRMKDGGRPWVDLPRDLLFDEAHPVALEVARRAAAGDLNRPATVSPKAKSDGRIQLDDELRESLTEMRARIGDERGDDVLRRAFAALRRELDAGAKTS